MAFTDDFTNGGGSSQSLGSRTGWTHVDGTAGNAYVSAGGTDLNSNPADESSFRCTDQASANHYTQYTQRDTGGCGSFVAVRLTNANNFIGVRSSGGVWELYKRNAGTFSLLGSYTAAPSNGDTVKLEASGNNLTVYINTVSRITATDSFNNTETRQGVVPRSSGAIPWIDNFEADVVGGGGGGSSIAAIYYNRTQQGMS